MFRARTLRGQWFPSTRRWLRWRNPSLLWLARWKQEVTSSTGKPMPGLRLIIFFLYWPSISSQANFKEWLTVVLCPAFLSYTKKESDEARIQFWFERCMTHAIKRLGMRLDRQECMVWAWAVATSKLLNSLNLHIRRHSVLEVFWAYMPYVYLGEHCGPSGTWTMTYCILILAHYYPKTKVLFM